MQTVVLIGGAGFIGSHIAERYKEEGYRVIVIDDLSTGSIENIQHLIDDETFIFFQTDFLDIENMRKIFEKYKPTIINNHAAQKSVPKSVEDPFLDNKLNIIGVLNLIQLAHEYGVKKILSASSGGALSKEIEKDNEKSKEIEKDNEKSKEIDAPQLVSPYAITKFSGEKYFLLYSQKYNFDYIGLRYANVFGPRQVAQGDCGVIPIFLNNILHNTESRLMTYSDMPKGCTRDYIYVSDVVDFNILATQYTEHVQDVFNLGISEEFYMLDIYKKLAKRFSSDAPIKIVGPRDGDVKRSVLDCTKVEEKFNWKTKVSLDEGIDRLFHYMSENEQKI